MILNFYGFPHYFLSQDYHNFVVLHKTSLFKCTLNTFCVYYLTVLGCPTPGFYGENCSLPCQQNCHCHITEGLCTGCFPGYIG